MPAANRRSPRLTEDNVLQAALELVETDGTSSFSMRKLAQKLDVTPMAIYRYFSSRDVLLDRLGDNVLRDLEETEGDSWREQLLDNALRTWRILSNYPGLATYLLHRPMSPQARVKVKHLIDILQEAGFDQETAELAWEAYHSYVYGLVALEAQFRRTGDRKARRERVVEFGIRAWLAGLDSQLHGTGAS